MEHFAEVCQAPSFQFVLSGGKGGVINRGIIAIGGTENSISGGSSGYWLEEAILAQIQDAVERNCSVDTCLELLEEARKLESRQV